MDNTGPGHFGSVTDRARVFALAKGVDALLHAASLLPPHLRDHSRAAFVDIIVHGTLAQCCGT